MRQFGMLPTMMAFAGHVPCSIGRVFPGIQITAPTWAGFKSTCLLMPDDPHFALLGQA